jgi:hypothetical protein
VASRSLPAFVVAALLFALPAPAQELARFSLDSVAAIDFFQGENASDRPNIIFDITGVVRLADGWLVYVRPWLRQPRNPTWEKEIYQAALQYDRRGRVATRVDAGYIVSPVGLGMMDTRPGLNPTILPHLSYLISMPLFDPTAPRVQPVSATYPLGAQLTLSTTRWDARGAIVNSAPSREFVINGDDNPRATPVVVGGAGLTPRVGLRLGISFAHGASATSDELTTKEGRRDMTLISGEAEYAFAYTKLSAEFTRTRFDTNIGADSAYAWFVQGVQTISPQWFVAARQEGVSAPPFLSGIVPGVRTYFHVTEATVGYRITADLTARGSFVSRKPFTRSSHDLQGGVSVVWAHRWW